MSVSNLLQGALNKRFIVTNGVIELSSKQTRLSDDENSSYTTQSSRSRASTEESITLAASGFFSKARNEEDIIYTAGFFTSYGDVEEYEQTLKRRHSFSDTSKNQQSGALRRTHSSIDLRNLSLTSVRSSDIQITRQEEVSPVEAAPAVIANDAAATAPATTANAGKVAAPAAQVVSKENFKAELKKYCFEGKTFGQKLKNLMVFIFLSIANFFKPDYAVSSLNGRVTK
jgi:hypothetical protein